MSVTGLHPEHLIEKEMTGGLDAAERSQLEAHLTQCAACRFERSVRADFASELAGDDPPIRISGFSLLSDAIEKPPPPAPLVVRRQRFRFTWLVAAAVLLLVATAVASESGRRVWMPMLGLQPIPVVVTLPQAPPAPPSVAHWTRITHEQTPDPTPVATTEEVTPEPAPQVAQPTSQMLFDQESDARRRGDYDRAIELHAQLVTKYPQSREAQVSRVTVARMLLDRGEASSALVGFDAYLKNGGGELTDEAMLGRATALERLSKNDQARTAWQELLDRRPDGPYAAHAKARIEALSVP